MVGKRSKVLGEFRVTKESWQEGDVETNGIRLHYTRTGGEKPPVVLAHGVTDSGLCWSPLAEELASDYNLIMVDARGHGYSDAPASNYGSVVQAADLAGVIAALGLANPFVLGHSMGALTALALAGTYPDLPRAILLEDPPPWWVVAPPDVAPGDDDGPAMDGWMYEVKRHTREELIASRRAGLPSWSEAELGPWADAKLRFSLNVTQFMRPGISAGIDWPDLLKRITCPALLITGDPEQGAIVSEDDSLALRRLIPQVEIVHIPGAGHNIRRDQFAPYLAAVRAFLTTGATT
jgi:N-formylmaleamate deformylase